MLFTLSLHLSPLEEVSVWFCRFSVFTPLPLKVQEVYTRYWLGGWYALLCCGLDLTFDFAVGTLMFKILSAVYLGNCKEHLFEGIGVHRHCV